MIEITPEMTELCYRFRDDCLPTPGGIASAEEFLALLIPMIEAQIGGDKSKRNWEMFAEWMDGKRPVEIAKAYGINKSNVQKVVSREFHRLVSRMSDIERTSLYFHRTLRVDARYGVKRKAEWWNDDEPLLPDEWPDLKRLREADLPQTRP